MRYIVIALQPLVNVLVWAGRACSRWRARAAAIRREWLNLVHPDAEIAHRPRNENDRRPRPSFFVGQRRPVDVDRLDPRV